MLKFNVTLHGATPSAGLPVTFDTVANGLALLHRMFLEPDGSFVWTGTTEDGEPWQVDGNLIDRGEVLAYVELKGACPEERFDELLSALRWPESNLKFQLPQRGICLDEAEFRRLAATKQGAV